MRTAVVILFLWACLGMVGDSGQNRQMDLLRDDRAVMQQQIAAEQARTRQLEAVVQQILTDRAQTSASVTTVPAGPYCNLHDIAVQNPGC